MKILIDEAVVRRQLLVLEKAMHHMQADVAFEEVESCFNDIRQALEQPAPAQEPVAHPFEDKSVILALSWAAGLIEQAYHAAGGYNGADSWLMNYADKQGERIRQADHREWEKVNGRWQAKATTPPTPAQDEYKAANIEAMFASNEAGFSGMTAAETIRELNRMVSEQPAPAQEPVAWRVKVETKLRDGSVDVGYQLRNAKLSEYDEPLYTTPPAPAQKPVIPQGWKLEKVEDDVRLTSPNGERWRFRATDGVDLFVFNFLKAMLNSAPPAPAQPLTQQEVVDGFCKLPHEVQYVSVFNAGVRFAEAAHGITKGGE